MISFLTLQFSHYAVHAESLAIYKKNYKSTTSRQTYRSIRPNLNYSKPITLSSKNIPTQTKTNLALPSTKQLPIPNPFQINTRGELFLNKLPNYNLSSSSNMVGLGINGNTLDYTFDPELQKYVYNLVKQASAPHIAVVVMDPKSGKVLAISDKSATLKNASLHAGFPAASLFKIITSAAALENTRLKPNSAIKFRGGTYQLNKHNFNPSSKFDKRVMQLDEALGHSCNPVFARVALQHLSVKHLKNYSNAFGFNTDLQFDTPMTDSSAYIPSDNYGLARTAAGFGQVYISPVHAASLMSAIANGGVLPRPYLVNQAKSKSGSILYQAKVLGLKRSVTSNTAKTLLTMMEKSVTSGTSRYAFYSRGKPALPGIRAVGKTGTLRGKNPAGLNRWFIGAAPLENPQVVVAAISINPRTSAARPSYMARQIFDQYLRKQKRNSYRRLS